MNTVLTFLNKNWQRLNLDKFGDPTRLSSMMVTPRFQASSHLIFFILSASQSKPILVAKVPRVPGDNGRLDREVENLNRIHTFKNRDFDSIPGVVAYEDFKGNRLLVETAMQFETMRPAVVRSNPRICIDAVSIWLIDLQETTINHNHNVDWFANLIKRPLDDFETMFPLNPSENRLLDATRKITQLLENQPMPLVFEHGDLSSPNILMGKQNKIAVVDWELAEPEGLPAVDLFFFLTYIAFALKGARKNAAYLAAFNDAFFGADAWALPHVMRYNDVFQISPELLKPLFVLCWSRYVVSLVRRLKSLDRSDDKLSNESANWLRSNRYYVLWDFAIKHIGELHLEV